MTRFIVALGFALLVNPASARQGVELRVGTLVPSHVGDGGGVHLAGAWRLNVAPGLWAQAELGVDRIASTGLTTSVEAPGGSLVLRGDHTLWSIPRT